MSICKKVKIQIAILDNELQSNLALEILKDIPASGKNIPVIIIADNINHFLIEKYQPFKIAYFFDRYNDFEKILPAINTIQPSIPS